jgi:hypothetical protein
MLNQIDINQSDIINEKMNLNKNKNKNISLLGNNLIKARANSDDEYNNIIQKQKDEVQRILNNHDDTYVNESSFDPTKSSPPNDFMRKLHNRLHKFNS